MDTTIEFPRDATTELTATNPVAGATLALLEDEAEWVVQDHLRGEMADFIAIRNAGSIARVDLVHCKKPGGNAGTRVTDIEELLAQAMRSVYLATSGSSSGRRCCIGSTIATRRASSAANATRWRPLSPSGRLLRPSPIGRSRWCSQASRTAASKTGPRLTRSCWLPTRRVTGKVWRSG